MKFYAVAKGRKTGIFTSWTQAEPLVKGFAGARYKSFATRAQALEFIENPPKFQSRKPASSKPKPPPCPVGDDQTLVVYTDGGALGNPGPGGYGVVFKDGRTFSGGANLTTNNRMELTAVIAALNALKTETRPIVLHSDSMYVINGITKGWARSWQRRGWKKSDGTPALNPDLWMQVLEKLQGLDITFRWVKGHAGDPMNEACDRLAKATAQEKDLPDDPGYLNGSSPII